MTTCKKNVRAKVGGLAWLVCLFGLQIEAASALPLTVFRYEVLAQRHCPNDSVVWLDFKRGRYYVAGQKLYAQGFDGAFVCKEEARSSGYRRSLSGLR